MYAYELLFFIVAFMTLFYDLFFVSTQYVLLHRWLALHFVVNLDNDNKDSILFDCRIHVCLLRVRSRKDPRTAEASGETLRNAEVP